MISKPTLLIVDDSPENIEVLRTILNEDYSIKVATNGETAIHICSLNPKPDLILLDIVMPGLNGFEVCRILKKQHTTCDIPIMIISAKNRINDEISGLNIGALDYISRPFEPEIVKMRVRNILALVEANKLKDDINNLLKHDVRTPLTVIMLNANDALSEIDNKEIVSQNLQIILDCADTINFMMSVSLELYNIERGVFNFNPKKIDLNDVTHKAAESMKKLAMRKKIKISVLKLNEFYTVNGDMLLLYSVVLNLLKNAIEASPENHEIEIIPEIISDSEISLSIINHGIIPEIIRPSIFKKYITFGKKNGSGLGLYSARLMTEIMNGKISFETNEENCKTKFSLILKR